jgi:ParB family transcriptional regulator, chromosome partitioning protein
MSTATTIPLNKLAPWKGNVRRTNSTSGIGELAASIHALGLQQPVIVMKNGTDKFLVVAGQRRLKALQLLAKQKKIAATFPVPSMKLDKDIDPTQVSLAENFQREQMHPADEFEAFKALIDGGMSADDVAAQNGIDVKAVEKRMKLANVAPSLIKLYREGGLTLNHMMAFAVTTDQEAQEKVWKDLPTFRRNDPIAIREALTVGEINASDRRVKFVGLTAYEKAGGAIRRDLFARDEDGAFILDKDLLASLVTAKLEKTAAAIGKEGWKWVEVRESFDHSEWSRHSRRHEEAAPLPPKKQAELTALEAELEPLMEADDGDEENPRIAELQAKIDKIEDRPRSWQADTLAIAGAVVCIGHNGKPEIMRGMVKPEDNPRPTKTVQKQNDDGTVTEEPAFALSAALIESLTTHRTAALSAVLKDKPDVALAALVSTLAGQVFFYSNNPCVKVRVSPTALTGVEDTKAVQALEAAEAKWKKQIPGKEEDLWAWCLKQKQPVLLDLLAFCVSLSIDAIALKGEKLEGARFQTANALAKAVGLDMTDYFKATAENYFGRISKSGIIEALKEAKVEITPAMEKAKKGELAAIADRELGPTKWLPEILRGPAP